MHFNVKSRVLLRENKITITAYFITPFWKNSNLLEPLTDPNIMKMTLNENRFATPNPS